MVIDNNDLASMKHILRKLINKHRIGGIHVEITQLKRWGLTEIALKYLINNFLLQSKSSNNNKELAINPHKMKEVSRIINEVNDVSQL
ncbi:hypothetical protein HYT53_02500 [Candidatus Woesearchaeota archaeon]|nr:hypothetical protein [Candidatus Woesearchaeota archaeon]